MSVHVMILIFATMAAALLLTVNGAVLVKPRGDSKVACFPAISAGWNDRTGVENAINDFCGSKPDQATWLLQFQTYAHDYAIADSSITISVSNVHCGEQGQLIDTNTCSVALVSIFNSCWIGNDGATDVGGDYTDSCGNWFIQLHPSGATRDLRDVNSKSSADHNDLQKRCTQYCYDPTVSGCHPPNWDSCTGAEKRCLVDNASDSECCLKAGGCSPNC